MYLEDNARDAELAQATLESTGIDCKITLAQTSKEFSESLSRGGYDIILADYSLPSYDGMSALRLVREHCPEIPFIFVSGTMGEDAAIQALTEGATDYVLKHKLSRLVPAVQRALREAQTQIERKAAEESLRHHAGELQMLYESGLAFSQLLDPKEIAQKIIELLGTKLEWHHAAVRLGYPESDRLELLAFSQPGLKTEAECHAAEERLNSLIARSGQGLSGWAVQHGETVRSGNVASDPRYIETNPHICSGLYVPLRTGGRTIGVISAESEQADAFNEADERLFTTLAAQAAVALENARLFQEAQQRLQHLTASRTIDRAIAGSFDLKLTLDIVLRQVLSELHLDAADILLMNKDSLMLDFLTGVGFRTSVLQHTHLPLGRGYAGTAALERRIIHVPDLCGPQTDFLHSPDFALESFVTYYAVPCQRKCERRPRGF